MEGVPPDTYLERFAWNEAKYPPRRPLKETVAAITETAQKLEDELKACLVLICMYPLRYLIGNVLLLWCNAVSSCGAHDMVDLKLCGVIISSFRPWRPESKEASAMLRHLFICVLAYMFRCASENQVKWIALCNSILTRPCDRCRRATYASLGISWLHLRRYCILV